MYSQVACLLLAVCLAQIALGQDDTCYINDSGFTCCNRALESAMKEAMSGNDLLGTADNIQSGAEGMFGGKFETVVAAEGKSCKIEKNGKYAAAWQP